MAQCVLSSVRKGVLKISEGSGRKKKIKYKKGNILLEKQYCSITKHFNSLFITKAILTKIEILAAAFDKACM